MARGTATDFWRSPFRLIQPNLRKIDARDVNVVALVDQLVDYGANATLINGGGIIAWYPTEHQLQGVNEYLQADFLGAFLDAAHARGLRVLVRMDVSKSFPPVYQAHPDWFRRTPDGQVATQWDMLLTCPTGPFWEVYNFEIVGELLRRYRIDGLFYNHFRFDRCYCTRCGNEFRSATGHTLPTREDWSDPSWRVFVDYRYERFSAYTARLAAFIHQQSPETVLTIDTRLTDDRPENPREAGWDAAALADVTGCITVESFNVLTRSQPKWIYWAGEEARLGRQLKTTCVILTYSEIFGSRRTAQPPAQVGYDLMQIAASGGAPAVALSGTFVQDDRKALPMIRSVMRFLEAHAAEYAGMEPVADVAVVYSQRTADFYGREAPASRWQAHYRGVYEALVESHTPFTVLHESLLLGGELGRYRCLVLPNVACLSDEQAAALDAYVRAGGHLVATFETGLYDRQGLPRPAGQALRSLGCAVVGRRQVSGSYLSLRDKDFVRGFPETDVVGLDGELLLTAPLPEASGLRSDLLLIPPVTNNTPEFAYWEDVGTEPGLLLNDHGRGTAAYLPWGVDRLYHQHGVPEYRQLLVGLVRRAAGEPAVETSAPSSVELLVARRPAGGYLLHLLNATGLQGKPQVAVVELPDVRVQVRGQFARARSLISGKDLALSQDSEQTSFTIHRLGLYEAVVVT